MSEVADAISALGSIIVAGAAVAAAIAAFMGLNTWKAQSLWQQDSELSKRALLAAFNYRDSLYAVRNPHMSGGEMALDEDDRGRISAANERSAGVSWRLCCWKLRQYGDHVYASFCSRYKLYSTSCSYMCNCILKQTIAQQSLLSQFREKIWMLDAMFCMMFHMLSARMSFAQIAMQHSYQSMIIYEKR